jgi:hypothetical protein
MPAEPVSSFRRDVEFGKKAPVEQSPAPAQQLTQ